MTDATVRERAAAAGYTAGWEMLRTLPHGFAARGFRAAADMAAVRNGAGPRQLRRNLRRVVGAATTERDLDALVGDGLRSYARYWLETFRLPSMDKQAVVDSLAVNVTGMEYYRAALDEGNGLIMALPHSGNWEASGIWLAQDSGAFTTVAERLRPESLFDRFVRYRESLGIEVLALTGGDRGLTQELTARLRAGRVVCLLADRDPTRGGMKVDFFGETARMAPGPALLAATTGAALLAIHPYFVGGDRWGHSVSPPVELPGERLRDRVRVGTQTLARHFADGIARHPADWHMLQPVWQADLGVSARDRGP